MPYITPNTVIGLLHNVPLDPTYDHTIYFTTAAQQREYFQSKIKYSFANQTFQRSGKGKLKIRANVTTIYDCNYLIFKNPRTINSTTYEKWWYAFIKSVEYVSEETSEITYEIDVMQTWHFDYDLDQCFVEREHTATDNKYEHLVDERLETGEYLVEKLTHYDMNDSVVCIMIAGKPAGSTDPAPSRTLYGIYNCTNFKVFLSPDCEGVGVNVNYPTKRQILTAISNTINALQEDDIICIYQAPLMCMGDATIDSNTGEITMPYYNSITDLIDNPSSLPQYPVSDYFTIAEPVDIGGYVPKNNKLFSYPYCFLTLSNNSGQTADFRWEDWRDIALRGEFYVVGTFATTPSVMCYPYGYFITIDSELPLSPQSLYDFGLVYASFPQCAWNGDTFKAWWAQNKNSVVTSTLTSVLSGLAQIGIGMGLSSTGVGAMAGVPQMIGGAVQAISAPLNAVAKSEDVKSMPNQVHGQAQCDTLNVALGRQRFTVYNMAIRSEYAKIIDDYFTRYGYAAKTNKIPARNVRPYWTYTKTIGCSITGSIPSEAAREIVNIYNNGITFWKYQGFDNQGHDLTKVCDYTQNNSPA